MFVKVSPQTGPVEGGTIVTILGQNLGSVFTEIESVLIGTVDCNLVSTGYLPSER